MTILPFRGRMPRSFRAALWLVGLAIDAELTEDGLPIRGVGGNEVDAGDLAVTTAA